MLYNSDPCDKDGMKCIETEIMSRVERQKCCCSVAYLKVGKSDGSEGLFSDHGNKHIHVFLSLIYTISNSWF